MITPTILVIDIECSPHTAYVFGNKWDPKIVAYREYSSMLSFSAKWLNGHQISKTVKDYRNEKDLLTELWKLIDRAEIVISWNGDKFDLRYLNSRFAKYGMPPPRPVRSVDLIKTSRTKFLLPSNSLDDFNTYFGLKRKLDNEKHLFIKCVEGDEHAFKQLKKYNANDVLITESAYKFLLPWIQNHPTLGLDNDITHCPKCESYHIKKNGFKYTKKGKLQQYQCQDCFSYSIGSVNLNVTIDEDNRVKARRPLTAI